MTDGWQLAQLNVARMRGATDSEVMASFMAQLDEVNAVAGVDQVGVLDLRVDAPDLRPQPRPLEETPADVPQRIALDHRVDVRVIVTQILGKIAALLGRGRAGDCPAEAETQQQDQQ